MVDKYFYWCSEVKLHLSFSIGKKTYSVQNICKKISGKRHEIGHPVENSKWLASTGRKGRRCHCQSRQLGGSRVKRERVAECTVRAGVLREGGTDEGGGATCTAGALRAPCGNKTTHLGLSSCRLRSQEEAAQLSVSPAARSHHTVITASSNSVSRIFIKITMNFLAR